VATAILQGDDEGAGIDGQLAVGVEKGAIVRQGEKGGVLLQAAKGAVHRREGEALGRIADDQRRTALARQPGEVLLEVGMDQKLRRIAALGDQAAGRDRRHEDLFGGGHDA
jgi:hypothetical protein